jgi:hypothetical protein
MTVTPTSHCIVQIISDVIKPFNNTMLRTIRYRYYYISIITLDMNNSVLASSAAVFQA